MYSSSCASTPKQTMCTVVSASSCCQVTFLPSWSQAPDFSGLVVAVDVCVAKFWQAAAVIDVAAGDRPRFDVRMGGRRRQNRRRPDLAFVVNGLRPFGHAPAVVASLFRRGKSSPTIPNRRRRPTATRWHWSKLIFHGLRSPYAQISPRAPFRSTNGLSLRNRILPAGFRLINVDPQDRATARSTRPARRLGNRGERARSRRPWKCRAFRRCPN